MAKTFIGTVSSSKSDKTIVVTVRSHKIHPLYKKQYAASRKFMAHDENNEAEVGDKVQIAETRPLSARKRFVLDKIIQKPVLRETDTAPISVPEAEEKPEPAAAKNDNVELTP